MDKERNVETKNKHIIRRIVRSFLIYLGTIFVGISILRFFDYYFGFIPAISRFFRVTTEVIWFWALVFMCLFGYPLYRKKREAIKGLVIWLKSLNWTKEDFKKIIIGILLIIFASAFITRPLSKIIKSLNSIDQGLGSIDSSLNSIDSRLIDTNIGISLIK